LNPLREDWDSSWKQEIKNKQFFEQVDWEHTALKDCDIIAMHFEEESKAPITLMELGLFANTGKAVIDCPKKYWRRGNVEYVAYKYNIPLFDSTDDFIKEIKKHIKRIELKRELI